MGDLGVICKPLDKALGFFFPKGNKETTKVGTIMF